MSGSKDPAPLSRFADIMNPAGMMKAMVAGKYGGPEILKMSEVEIPEIADDGILVKVVASTVNRTDCGFLTGKPWIARLFSGLRKPRFSWLGNEYTGIVVKTGVGVTTCKIGDRVFGMSGVDFSAHAEYIAVRQKDPIGILPGNIGFIEGAPLLEGCHYAWNDILAARVTRGQQVMVNGATGAIGSAAVQLMKHLGAEVWATCSTEHLKTVSKLGADVVIDYTQVDFTRVDQKFDFVFDSVGKSTFGKCRRILKPRGIYISTELGPYWQNPWLALITSRLPMKRALFPLPVINQSIVDFIGNLAEKGEYRPLVDRVYSMEEIPDAFRYVLTGMKTGNVVIRISEAESLADKHDDGPHGS